MTFTKTVSPKVFHSIQNVDIDELAMCFENEIRPILPCLVRMSLISPLDTSSKCSKQKIDILTIISGVEYVNSIVALLSIDFHALESDVRKEQQLRQKNCASQHDSVLISNLPNGLALEYERSDMTRRLRLVLSELLFIQSQIQDVELEQDFYMKSSELFDNDIYIEEISDVICIALAELPMLLNVHTMAETLLHVQNGPAIICRVVANFPDSFREVCTSLIQRGEKQEEGPYSSVRLNAITMLCKMNPSQALAVRSKCVELCRMPALAIMLSLAVGNYFESDTVAFVSGLLLGNDQTIRNWFALFIRTGQKRKGEVSSTALQLLREDLLFRLESIIRACSDGQLPDSYVVQASALLRLYCALRGIAAIKFQDEEVNLIVQLLTSHPNPTPAGVRFASLGLCMLIACPSLVSQPDHEKRSIDWVQWLVREEAYFESTSGVSASFGEMLLLMAIHFHSNQLSAICDLVCATLGMKIPIRHNNMTRMKQVFTQEIFTEQVVTSHAVKVPVTPNLNANMTGFLPVHCIHQLLKSRAFAKHNVNIKSWIYQQICASTNPLHSVLPLLVEVYVTSIIVCNLRNMEVTNKPLSENEIRRVFQSSIFGQYFDSKRTVFNMDFDINTEYEIVFINENSLTPQLLLLYYLLLYEDCRLTNAQSLTASGRKIKLYSAEFMSELPIKYLLHHAQKDQISYSGLFGPLLKLLTTHFPHLTLVEDWLDDMSFNTDHKSMYISELSVVESFMFIESNPSKCAKMLRTLLKMEPIDIWSFAEVFTQFVRQVLNKNVPRYVQELYKNVWLRLNTVLPRRLWALTIKNVVDNNLYRNTRSDLAEDPLVVMKCDEKVFRCAPIYSIMLRVLRASLASSRSQLQQHLQSHPKLDHSGQAIGDLDREEMCRALVAAQDSAAVQMLLETCIETLGDKETPGQLLALQEVRSLVCSHLHQAFIIDTSLAKLIHFQGYPSALLNVTIQGIPSMHICLDFLLELMQQPSINKQVFGIQLLSHLSIQYALPKSLNLCVTALNLLYALLGAISAKQGIKLFKDTLPALVLISEAFPPLVEDIVQFLIQLSRVCRSQASVASYFHDHLMWDSDICESDSKKEMSNVCSEDDEYIEDVVCKVSDLKENEMKVFDLQDAGKVLLVKQKGKLTALGAKCTHYGAPLQNGVLGDGRVRCQWHGACFNVTTGDIEDFPGLDSLPCYQVRVHNENVKVRARRSELQSNKRLKTMINADPNDNKHYVVVGGGPSGAVCVETLRQEGFTGKITLFTKENYLPYDRVKLSKAMDIEIAKLQFRNLEYYQKHNIDIRINHEVTKIDGKQLTLSDNSSVKFDRLYIATGSSARKADIPGADLKNIVVLRSYDDAATINSLMNPNVNVVILGSSFIGMEAAAFCVGKVAKVTVISKTEYPFQIAFGKEVGAAVLKMYKEKGVEFLGECGIKACLDNGKGELGEVELENGSKIKADVCIMGIGSTLNTDFLRNSGIDMTNYGGVNVNEYLETSVPNIYAGGDIAYAPILSYGDKAYIGHFGLAQYHGKIAGMNMMNKRKCLEAVPFFWTMLFGKSFRYCGYGSFTDVLIKGDIDKLVFAAYYFKDDQVVAMCACSMDPIVSKYAEFVAQGNKLYKKDLQKDPTEWDK
ncbi:hypothetical protein FQA39_LY12244 [Lamprigera yunnana]|nr:hypothetical protein FQA39_LY12244 [Lamprigera yunnana]